MGPKKEGGFRLKQGQSASAGVGPLISVITVVYNGEAYLEKTISSVLNQTYANVEYLIIDGGSQDSTLQIIEKYEDRIAYWISEPDSGISDAFNKGITHASGDIIGLLNADDWYEPDALQAVAAHYKLGCVLHGSMQYWNKDGSKGLHVMPNQHLLPSEMSLNHPTVFIPKDLYLQYGLFSTDYKFAMDYHLLLRLYLAQVPFVQLNKTLANMRSGGTSANWLNSYRETKKAKDELLGHSIKHQLFYNWQVTRRTVSETLAKTPLSFINSLYRLYLSPMKKV